MQLELKKETPTPLLSRKRATFMVQYKGATPSRLDLRKEVAKKTGSKEELIILKHIYTRFGLEKAKIIAHIYSNAEDLKKYEAEYLTKKHEAKKAEGEAEAAAPAEVKPAEAPAEEKKEEAPAEEKPAEEKKE